MFIVRFVIILAELILCFVLQSSVWGSLTVNQAIPDLLMVIVVAIAYIKGSNAGIVYGFLAGMLLDITYGKTIGFFALIYLFCGFLAGVFHRFYRKDDNVTPLLLTSAGVFLCQNVCYVTEFVLKRSMDYSFFLVNIVIPRMVVTILFAAVLYKLFQCSILWSVRLEERN